MPNEVESPHKPLVIIDPYQFDGDIAIGMWTDKHQRYVLSDGDAYSEQELERFFGGQYTLLSLVDLELRLRLK